MTTPRKFYDRVLDHMCERLIKEIPSHYSYHSLRHTLDVIEQCILIAKGESLSEEEIDTLKIAALFHDSGYIRARKEHEQHSAQIFTEYAQRYELSPKAQELVRNCILATRIPQSPKTLLEKVLCDADLDYLGREDFMEIGESLFQEMHACSEIPNRESWNILQIKFLSTVCYHTSYSQKTRTQQLQQNLEHVKQLLSS